jgi:hypothetical protein
MTYGALKNYLINKFKIEPTPEPGKTPEPGEKPEPGETPEPKPEPGKTPEPKPEPGETPEPKPEPGETPEPKPEPGKTPEPGETPEPKPEPGETPEPTLEDADESFTRVVGSSEYQEALKRYQEEVGFDEEKKAEEKKEEGESFDRVVGTSEYQEAFDKYQEEVEEVEEEGKKDKGEDSKLLKFIKEGLEKGEKREIKYKGESGWYVTKIDEKDDDIKFSIKKINGNDAEYSNVSINQLDLLLRNSRKK